MSDAKLRQHEFLRVRLGEHAPYPTAEDVEVEVKKRLALRLAREGAPCP